MTHKLAAPLLGALAVTAASFAIAPVASADVCGDVGGRHVSVGGCTPGLAGDAVDAAVIGAAVDRPYDYAPPPAEWPPLPPGYLPYPSFPGEAPCYTAAGQPYYTPSTMPCYPA
ncbi:MAG: hypothetical protein KDB50_03240 [Mycobacterium sp.]|nr:hypothetical protein [Mycobacterium sp.]